MYKGVTLNPNKYKYWEHFPTFKIAYINYVYLLIFYTTKRSL